MARPPSRCWSCVLAMRLAEVAGLDDELRRQVYHQALLRYIGCNADTYLLCAAFGDEIALRPDLARIDLGSHSEIVETFVRAFTRLFADAPPAEMADAIQKGLAEALQVSVPIPGRHHVRNIAQARNGQFEIVKSLGAIEPNEAIVSNNAQFGGGAAAE